MPLLTASSTPDASAARIDEDLKRYVAFGHKQAGSDGDNQCGAWLADELAKLGFQVERQEVSVPWFTASRAEITTGNARAKLWPQPIVETTGVEGLTARLVRVDSSGNPAAPLTNAIALVELASGRWSTALAKAVRSPIEAAFAGGARAAVVVTTGPTGKIIALNTDGNEPMFEHPVALLAPEDAVPFFAAAASGATATLQISGAGGRRRAFNLIARLNRAAPRWLVVSTPRSGWYTCAGERGGGIATWLHIARWAQASVGDHNLAFICNTGHEYENLGAEKSLKAAAPKPDETAFWLHLGANLAARDWHDSLRDMTPLPGPDSQRYLVVTSQLLEIAKTRFSGLAGLEAVYRTDQITAGELTGIVNAGYSCVAGVFGLHRFHHVAEDDARCLSPRNVNTTADAFLDLTKQALAT